MQRGTFDSLYRENTMAPLACTPATCTPIPSLANPLIQQKHHVSPIALIIDSGEFNLQSREVYRGAMLTCWPKPTNRKLISAHKLEGNHDWRVCRVCSGVAFSATHPRRWQTRFTFVSTIMPSSPLKQLLDFNCLWLRPFVFLMTTSRVVTWHCLAWPNNMFYKLT